MPRSSRADVEEHMISVLRYIGSEGCGGGVCVSQVRLAQELGSTISRVRLAVARLSAIGCVKVDERYLPNGGQLENRYLVTEKGMKVLELHGCAAHGRMVKR